MTRYTLVWLVCTVVIGVVPRTRLVDVLEIPSFYRPFRVLAFL